MTSVAVCFYFGFQFALEGGAIVAFYMYLSKFFNPVQQLADQLNNLQKALTACLSIVPTLPLFTLVMIGF